MSIDIPTKPIPIKGSIFNTDKFGLDGIIVWVPCGLTSIRGKSKKFVENEVLVRDLNPIISGVKEGSHHYQLFQPSTNSGYLRYIFWHENPNNVIEKNYCIRQMVFYAMNVLVNYGCKRIGMNGIRGNGTSEESEKDLIRAVKDYMVKNSTDTIVPLEAVYLIDSRTGFLGHSI